MRILSSIGGGTSVRQALRKAAAELNGKLAETPGRIAHMKAKLASGLAGATVRVVVVVDEGGLCPKCIIWANEAGGDEGAALRRAGEKINAQLNRLKGEAAGFYIEFIRPPLPRRVYATMIVAVNEEIPERIGKLTADERRERLAAAIKLLASDPKAVNISRIAELFSVSRDVLYEDLKKLGFER